MKPFPQKGLTATRRIFNYRLSRARNTSENAFGILVQRFRVLITRLDLAVKNSEKIVLCACLLHNILCTHSSSSYAPQGFADEVNIDGEINQGEWRKTGDPLVPLEPTKAKNAKISAKKIREMFSDYFQTNGSVPWQYASANI